MAKIFLFSPRGGRGDFYPSIAAESLVQISWEPAVCKYETYSFPEIVAKAHACAATKLLMAS